MIFANPLDLVSTPQVFPLPGGQSGSLNIYLKFASAPSAGTVSIEYLRPGTTAWAFLQGCNAASITSGALNARADGGISQLRVTFSGLTGGASPFFAVSADPSATPPSDLLTDGGFGSSRRIRVDPGQTGFFAGKFFRSYLESVIPVAGPPIAIRFTSPIDFILWAQTLTLTQGALRMEVFTGTVTPSGTWTATPAGVIGANRMAQRPQPPYTSQVTLETGGTFTGGTPVDLMLVRCATNQGNSSSQNAGSESTERGLPAGVYYIRFSTLTGGVVPSDAAQMIYTLEWEERPIIT